MLQYNPDSTAKTTQLLSPSRLSTKFGWSGGVNAAALSIFHNDNENACNSHARFPRLMCGSKSNQLTKFYYNAANHS